MKDWYVGQRVVCVAVPGDTAKRPLYWRLKEKLPEIGKIYTLRTIEKSLNLTSSLAVRLEEIVNPILQYKGGSSELMFGSILFRPLDESRLDQFRVHLKPVPKKEEINA